MKSSFISSSANDKFSVSSERYSFWSLFKVLNANFKEMIAIRLEIRSDRAPAPHTPFNPKKLGKISSRGISKSTCLKSPKNVALLASPIA